MHDAGVNLLVILFNYLAWIWGILKLQGFLSIELNSHFPSMQLTLMLNPVSYAVAVSLMVL